MFKDFKDILDDIFNNWFWIIKLVVYPRHFKNKLTSHIAKKATGASIFAKQLVAARDM